MLLVAPKGHPFKHTRYCWDTGGETCTCDAREEEDDGRATAASATTDNQILDFDQTDFLIDFDDDDSATLPTIDLEHPCATASPSIATNSSSSSCLSSPEVDLQSYIFGGISPAPTSAYPPPISPHDTTTFDTLCDFDFDINSLLSDNSPAVSQLSEEELYELYTHTATPTTSTTTSPSTVIVNQSSPLVVGCDSYTLFGGELGVAYHSTDTTFATTSNTNTLATQESSSKETTTMATATTTTATYNNHPFVGGISTFNRKDMDMFNNGKPLYRHDAYALHKGFTYSHDLQPFTDFELYGHEHNTPRHQQSQQTSHHRGSHVVGRMLVSPAMSNMSDDFGSVVSGASASSITVGVNTSSSSPVTAFSRPMKRKATDTPSTNPLPTPPPSKPFRTPQTPAMSYTSTSTSTASAQTPLTRPASPTQILEEAAGDTVAVKRARNTLAARRYRQKRVERLEELEALLVEAERERERYKEEAMNWRMECEKWRGRYEGVVMGGGGSGNPGAGQK
ncbi:hypothetical protein DFH27DRAFT_562642 [Peziza echinospora]|nr:hypothetical protein DFH27DRAFT_562642 [Peziza echinospora]